MPAACGRRPPRSGEERRARAQQSQTTILRFCACAASRSPFTMTRQNIVRRAKPFAGTSSVLASKTRFVARERAYREAIPVRVVKATGGEARPLARRCERGYRRRRRRSSRARQSYCGGSRRGVGACSGAGTSSRAGTFSGAGAFLPGAPVRARRSGSGWTAARRKEASFAEFGASSTRRLACRFQRSTGESHRGTVASARWVADGCLGRVASPSTSHSYVLTRRCFASRWRAARALFFSRQRYHQ